LPDDRKQIALSFLYSNLFLVNQAGSLASQNALKLQLSKIQYAVTAAAVPVYGPFVPAASDNTAV
jgi:hypothetical protein